jgi:hypothetical protein
MRRPLLLTVPLTLGVIACDLTPDSTRVAGGTPPAAAVLAPGEDVELIDKLAMVAVEIERALEGEPARVLTAEALTDQLMHAPRDIDWLATGYSVEARVRQIQAQADAIVAKMRRGSSLNALEPDLRALQASVRHLREQLQVPGGGTAPPSLETLLAQDPLRGAQATIRTPAQDAGAADTPATTGPLGTPITQLPDG